MNKKRYQIFDWAGNLKFNGKSFNSFQEAWGYLDQYFDENNLNSEEWAQEYYVEKEI